ncbi:MAG: hypothetical protein AAB468_02475 [Patescibacteria group bacterium]
MKESNNSTETPKIDLFGSVSRGAISFSLNNFAVKFLVAINTLILLLNLSVYQYGVYKLVFSIYLVARGILLPGLDSLVLNEYIAKRQRGDFSWGNRLFYDFICLRFTLSLMAFTVFFVGSQMIAERYSPGVGIFLRPISFLLLLYPLSSLVEIVLRSTLNFWMSSFISILHELVKLLLIVGIVLSSRKLDISTTILITVVATAISNALLIFYIVARYRSILIEAWISRHLGGGVMWNLLRSYGKWAVIKGYVASLPDSVRLWLIKVVISTEAVAIFSLANSLVGSVRKLIPTQMLSSLVPRFMGLRVLGYIYFRLTKYYIWLSTLMLIASFVLLPPLVVVMFPHYAGSLAYFKLLVFSLLLGGMALNKQIVYSARRHKFLFLLPFVELIILVGLGPWMASRWGLYGVSANFLISETAVFLIVWYFLWKIMPSLSDFSVYDFFEIDDQDKRNISRLIASLRERYKRVISVVLRI